MVLDRYAFLALSFPLALAAGAQSITLVAPGNVPVVGTSYSVHQGAYVAPVPGGAGLSFDFSASTSTQTLTYAWTAPNVSPNAGLFPLATMALINGGPDTVFYRETAQGLERVGETRTITALGANFPAGYSDGVLEMSLPITFGDVWTDAIAGSFTLNGNAAVRTGNITGSADAYGYLSVPNGIAPIEVLRLNSYVDETIVVQVGIPLSIHHTRRVVAYMPLWGKFPVYRTVTDSLSAVGTYQVSSFTEWLDPTSVGIASLNADPFALRVFPDPAMDKATVVFNSNSASMDLQVVDVRGATVMHVVTKDRSIDLDLSHWNAGIYQVLLTSADGQRSTRRLVVAH